MREGRAERRSSARVSPKGTVSLRTYEFDVQGRISNISPGGVNVTTLVTAPQRVLGRNADLELRFDTQHSAWVQLSGKILRLGATSMVVGFDTVPDGFDKLLDEVLTASHMRKRWVSLVLVDATVERRLRLAEAFRVAGCAVVDVSTPLEAIVRLGEFHFEPDIVAIADSLPVTISDELRRFISSEHPRAKLVTIGDQAAQPEGLAHWLSSLDPGGDLAARVRHVLTSPNT